MMEARRCGTSLAECVVVMTLVGAVLGTISVTMHALYRTDRRTRDAMAYDRAIDRFAEQLRTDAHQAELAAGGDALILSLEDGRSVRYTAGPEAIERIVQRGNATVHHETYPLKAMSEPWQVRQDGALQLLAVALAAEPEGPANDDAIPGPCWVRAAVGLYKDRGR